MAGWTKIVQNEGEVLVTDMGFPWLAIARLGHTAPTERELRGSVPRLTTASEILIRQDRDVRSCYLGVVVHGEIG